MKLLSSRDRKNFYNSKTLIVQFGLFKTFKKRFLASLLFFGKRIFSSKSHEKEPTTTTILPFPSWHLYMTLCLTDQLRCWLPLPHPTVGYIGLMSCLSSYTRQINFSASGSRGEILSSTYFIATKFCHWWYQLNWNWKLLNSWKSNFRCRIWNIIYAVISKMSKTSQGHKYHLL